MREGEKPKVDGWWAQDSLEENPERAPNGEILQHFNGSTELAHW